MPDKQDNNAKIIKNNKLSENINQYKEIVDYAHKGIDWVKRQQTYLFWTIGIIVAVGIAFTHRTAIEFKNDLKNHGEIIKNNLISEYESINKIKTAELNSHFEQLKKDYDNKIASEFAKENVQHTLNEAAKQQADKIIRDHLTVAIEQAIAKIDKEREIASQVAQMGYESLWQNAYGGNRKAFEILSSEAKKIDAKQIYIGVAKEVESFYNIDNMIEWVENITTICKYITTPGKKPCSEGFEPPIGYNAKNVFDHLEFPLWTERGRAACLLRNVESEQNTNKEWLNQNKETFYNRLISHMNKEKENSLFVSVIALNTYSKLTGFLPSDVFDFTGALSHWENNKEIILNKNF